MIFTQVLEGRLAAASSHVDDAVPLRWMEVFFSKRWGVRNCQPLGMNIMIIMTYTVLYMTRNIFKFADLLCRVVEVS